MEEPDDRDYVCLPGTGDTGWDSGLGGTQGQTAGGWDDGDEQPDYPTECQEHPRCMTTCPVLFLRLGGFPYLELWWASPGQRVWTEATEVPLEGQKLQTPLISACWEPGCNFQVLWLFVNSFSVGCCVRATGGHLPSSRLTGLIQHCVQYPLSSVCWMDP